MGGLVDLTASEFFRLKLKINLKKVPVGARFHIEMEVWEKLFWSPWQRKVVG
jgi:hypothetical protein